MIMHPILAALFAPSGQQGGGMSVFIIQIGLFVAIFYFLLIRPQRQQQKKHKELLDSLQKGDQVVTSGGLVGEVIHIKDNQVTIKSGESRMVITRSSVASITNRTVGEVKEAPKDTPKEIKPA
jgi:preprotein translocase subunit YajC